MTANIFNQCLKMGKLTTEPMLECGALYTKCLNEFTKHNLEVGSEFVQAFSNQLGSLAQTKTPEEFCKQQTEFVLSQIPKSFEHTENLLGIMQKTVGETGKLMQKHATQYCKEAQSTQK